MRIEVVPFRTFLLAGLALAGVAACGSRTGGSAPRVPVSVARAERRALPYELEATATADAAAAAVRSDSAAAGLAQLNLEYATVRAPIGGRTGRLLLHEGNLVRAGSNPLVSIVQMRPILVRFPVPATNLPALRQRRGQQLTTMAMPARDSASAVQGVLSFVDNQVDTSTGTVLLKAQFSNRDGGLWPGEFVAITLILGMQNDALVVPRQAVMQGQQGTYVFVVNNAGTATTQPVTVERTLDSLTVVVGVPTGSLVVTDGQLRLTPNAKVDIRGGPTTETSGGTGSADNPR